jgi:hypothetical protein
MHWAASAKFLGQGKGQLFFEATDGIVLQTPRLSVYMLFRQANFHGFFFS